jgi:hypothetical protein
MSPLYNPSRRPTAIPAQEADKDLLEDDFDYPPLAGDKKAPVKPIDVLCGACDAPAGVRCNGGGWIGTMEYAFHNLREERAKQMSESQPQVKAPEPIQPSVELPPLDAIRTTAVECARLFPEDWEVRSSVPYGDGVTIFCGRHENNKTIIQWKFKHFGMDERAAYFIAAQPKNIIALLDTIDEYASDLVKFEQERDAALARADKAEAERDAALSEIERLNTIIEQPCEFCIRRQRLLGGTT